MDRRRRRISGAGVLVLAVGLTTGSGVAAAALRSPLPAMPPERPILLKAFSEGKGAPLVMLGGGTGGAAAFAPHAQTLARQYRVMRFEAVRRERSLSRQPLPVGYSIETESAALARTLDNLGIKGPVHLVGHSFGALVALDFALDHPGRVRTLTLCEPPAFWVVPPEELGARADIRSMRELLRMLTPDIEPTDEHYTRFLANLGKEGASAPAPGDPGRAEWDAKRAALRGLSAVGGHTDNPARLASFRRPVLIVTGARTVPFHRRINELLAERFPVVEKLELPGGHDAPGAARDEFLAGLNAFLTRHR